MSKPTRAEVTPEELHDLLIPDYATGLLVWRYRPQRWFPTGLRACRSWNARFAEEQAFIATNNHGYKVGTLFGKIYTAHRVMWALAYRAWPSKQIDHINGNRTDNSLQNLRLVSNSDNHKNQKMPSTNTSGIVGVRVDKRTGAWVSDIFDAGKRIYVGTFSTKEEAVAARKEAERRLGYHANHGRRDG